MSALSNPLLESGLSQFDGTVDLDALQGFHDPGFGDENGDGVPDHYNQELAPLHTNHRGYIGDDGAVYRKELGVSPDGEISREYTDERLYFWTPPQELGRAANDPSAQEDAMAGPEGFGAAGLYTESEIREAWDADEGMGYLKQHTDWDSYWNFVQKTTDLFTDPTYNDMTDGNMTVGNFQDSPEYMALLEESGIPTQYVNDDGDVFNFNGTTYVKDYKTDDSIGVEVINSVALGLIGGVVAGPLVAGALGSVLGPAAAKAASSAIINLASQYVTTGELEWEDALVSAATSYGGAQLGEVLQGSGSLGSIGDKISGVTDKFTEVLDKTGNIGSAAIKAGGMSLLTQMVTTGEIDIKTAGIAALMAGGSTAFQEWTTSMYDAGVELTSDDLQEIVVEAKRVGTDVGGGMTALEGGTVINEAGEIVGNMADIDLDGDGMLSGNDLQEITTPDRDLVDPNIGDENIYGDVDLAPPDSTTNPDAFTKGWMEDRYAGMTREQMINQMQADGFGYDPETGKFEDYAQEYLDEWDATNDLNLQELNTASYGAIDVNMEDPYTIGQTDEGTYYIAKTDELTGEVSFKAITEEQFNDLYGEFYGGNGQSGAIGNGDWSGVEDYLVEQSLADGGNIITGGFDADGNPVGDTEGISVDDWVTLEEGSFNNTAVPIDDFVDAEPDPVEQIETDEVETDSSANADPNDSTDAGEGDSGGGETDSTGGSGASGAVGGGGTTGGGAPAGGSSGGSSNDVVVDINNPIAGGNVSDDNTVNDNTVNDDTVADPSDGTGTPVAPPMNAQIEALMERGMTYEQAVANQNAAISAGADANSDGMVTNAEWAAHSSGLGGDGGSTGGTDTGSGTGGAGGGSSSGSGSTGGGDVGAGTGTGTGGSGSGSGDSGNTAGGNGTGGGIGNGGGSGQGTGGGTNGGTGSGGSTGAGTGSGTEPGSGGGAGGGGNGGGVGNGAGMLGGSGDNSNPTWGPLFPAPEFRKFQKRRSGIVQSLFEDLMK